jgi:hypothetical protein
VNVSARVIAMLWCVFMSEKEGVFIPIIRKPAARLRGADTMGLARGQDPKFFRHFPRNLANRTRIVGVE